MPYPVTHPYLVAGAAEGGVPFAQRDAQPEFRDIHTALLRGEAQRRDRMHGVQRVHVRPLTALLEPHGVFSLSVSYRLACHGDDSAAVPRALA